MLSFFSRRFVDSQWRHASAARRFFRPLVEGLESRELLAFDLTISLAATAGVDASTASGTTTFTASANGAHLSANDINAALAAGNNVVVSSGSSGTQAGNISTSGFTSFAFANVAGTRLTIRSGSGANSVGNVTLVDLRLNGDNSAAIVQAAGNVSISRLDSANDGPLSSVILSSGGGLISLNGEVKADTARLKAAGDITQSASGIITAHALGVYSTTGNVDVDVAANMVAQFAARTEATDKHVEFRNATVFATGQVTSSGAFNVTVTGVTTNRGAVKLVSDSDTLTVGTAGVANSGISTGAQDGEVTLQAANVLQTAEGAITSNALSVESAGNVALAAVANDNNNLAIAATGRVDYRDAGAVTVSNLTASGIGGVSGFEINMQVGGDLLLKESIISFGVVLPGVVRIVAGGKVESQGGTFYADNGGRLGLRAGGEVKLSTLGIVFQTVAIFATGEVEILLGGNMTVGTVDAPNPNPIGFAATTGIVSGNSDISVISDSAQLFQTTVSSVIDAGTASIIFDGQVHLANNHALGDNSTLVGILGAVVNLSVGDETIGGLAGTGAIVFPDNTAVNRLMVGGNNVGSTFAGSLVGQGDPQAALDGFIKEGIGTLTLSGTNSFIGTYEVREGKLLVTGSIASSTREVQVITGGTLGGTGTINRSVALTSGARLTPGTSTGTLSTRALQFGQDTHFDVEITSAAAGGFDQANVTGSVIIATTGVGVALDLKALGTLNLQNGNRLVIVNNDGSDAIQGTFKNLPEGSSLGSNFLGSGLTANITYKGISGTDNDVVLLISPGSLTPWHNDGKPLDSVGGLSVQPDGRVDPGDALAIINYINAFAAGPIPESAILGLPFGFLDTDGDNEVSPGDALSIINAINAGLGGEGEEEVAGGAANSELFELLAMDATQHFAIRRRR